MCESRDKNTLDISNSDGLRRFENETNSWLYQILDYLGRIYGPNRAEEECFDMDPDDLEPFRKNCEDNDNGRNLII